MLYKKAQGMSMNVIIIAAIALLILVILSVLILRAGKNLSDANTCLSVDGASCELDTCPTGMVHHGPLDDTCDIDSGEICCIPL